ncbi:hypothetical protein Pd630_LPD10068 (plasmid) [Rhodococcus opacus PD630]|nr:hypothetical protein Pd630_LPD10068 [Rhodococcus opacus PD630]
MLTPRRGGNPPRCADDLHRVQRRGEASPPREVLIVSGRGTIYSDNRDEQQVATHCPDRLSDHRS